MALQASGTISFSNIISEFGDSRVVTGQQYTNLGAYRVSQTVGALANLPLDAGIPQSVSIGSSTIKFSDFYNKRLNVVVNFWSGDPEFRVNGRSRYIDNNVSVIGNFRGRPTNSSGIKVFIHANKRIGSTKSVEGENRYVALFTGGWDSDTTLQVDVGPSGYITGAGGDGGLGGSECEGRANGTAGTNGTSGLGVQYPATIVNRGYISCGYGGGGGGGCGSSDPDKNQRDYGAAGGGGGGGGGYPIGNGGRGGRSCIVGIRPVAAGGGGSNSGFNGSGWEVRGGGGNGGTNPGCSGGGGGAGGDHQTGAAGGGGRGSGPVGPRGSGGGAGANGYSIIRSPGITYSLTNSGIVRGAEVETNVL